METIKIDKYLTDEEVIEKQKEIEKSGKVVISISRMKENDTTEFKAM